MSKARYKNRNCFCKWPHFKFIDCLVFILNKVEFKIKVIVLSFVGLWKCP